MSIDTDRAIIPTSIAVIALLLLVWAIVDFIRVDGHRTRADAMPAAETTVAASAEAIALHRVLPDATNALGRIVQVDGKIASVEPGAGYWVRDLRDYVVFVERAGESPVAGGAVSVRGRITILSAEERADRLRGLDTSIREQSMLVRDIKIVPEGASFDLPGG